MPRPPLLPLRRRGRFRSQSAALDGPPHSLAPPSLTSRSPLVAHLQHQSGGIYCNFDLSDIAWKLIKMSPPPLEQKKCLRSEFVVSSCPSRIKLSHFVICFGFHPSQTNQQMQCVYRCFLDKLRSRHRRLEDCSISQIVRHVAPIKNELRETCRFVQFNRGANSLSESTCSSNEKRK